MTMSDIEENSLDRVDISVDSTGSIARRTRNLQAKRRRRLHDDAHQLVGNVDELLRLLAVEMTLHRIARKRHRGYVGLGRADFDLQSIANLAVYLHYYGDG